MTNKINWKQKLSSRKFWAMLGGQVTAVLTAFNANESLVLQITAIIGSFGMFAVYMLAESAADKGRGGMIEVEEIATIESGGQDGL